MPPLVLLILLTTLVRLGFAAALGLGVDESYMVVAGRSLSLGYFDHPPAAWWLSWAAAHLAGTEAPIVVRLPFIAAFALSSWLMARLGAAIAGEAAGLWAAVLLNLSPVFGVTTGTWVLPDGPLDCALLGAALCLTHALVAPVDAARDTGSLWEGAGGGVTTRLSDRPLPLPPPTRGGDTFGRCGFAFQRSWWSGAGLCAGLALFSKYSAVLAIGGAALYLLTSRAHRHWLRRPHPYIAAALALLVFAPVVAWNATHQWASFAFQGERAAGLRFHPLAPFGVLAGEAVFVLPWIWLPMIGLLLAAFRRGPAEPRSWLLACLAAPPIVLFAAIAAWSGQRVLFHWAAPGYLMLFPLLGAAVAQRLDHAWVRRTLAGTVAFVVLFVAVVGTQVRLDWLHPVIAAVARRDPSIEAIEWTSVRDDLEARGLLRPGTIVGVPNWRDAGKLGHALGPDVTVVCLNRDARQFGVATPQQRFVGADVLLLVVEHPESVARELTPMFDRIDKLPPAPVRHLGRVLAEVSVWQAHRLRAWPPLSSAAERGNAPHG